MGQGKDGRPPQSCDRNPARASSKKHSPAFRQRPRSPMTASPAWPTAATWPRTCWNLVRADHFLHNTVVLALWALIGETGLFEHGSGGAVQERCRDLPALGVLRV